MRCAKKPTVMVQRFIKGIVPKDGRPGVYVVSFVDGDRTANIRSDLMEVYPGAIMLQKWLDDKIFNDGGV